MIRLLIVSIASIAGILFVAFIASRIARSRRTGLSIRMQVFLALASVVGAFAIGVGLLVLDRVQARAVRFATQAASDEAQSIAGLLSAQWNTPGAQLQRLAKRLEHQSPAQEGSAWRLEDSSGVTLFRQSTARLEGSLVHATAPIILNGQATGRVIVSKPTVVLLQLVKDFAPTVLLISLVLGAAAALSAFWIGRAIAAPIEALSAFSERVSRGRQGAHPPPSPWGREVTRLTLSIDSMRRQLEGRPFAERFATDLSHELKNPVAAIRASAEVLEEGALNEPERALHFVGRIRQSTARIERLLSELLQLAHMEAKPLEEHKPLDLEKLCRMIAEQSQQSARFQLDLPPSCVLQGEEHWLDRALRNLLDNAAIHSTPGSAIMVSLSIAQGQAQLSVSNQGEITEHLQQRMFQRFVTTREDKGGTGLGLAIVKAIAEAHGGRVWLSEAGPPRVTVCMSLPLRPDLAAQPSPTA